MKNLVDFLKSESGAVTADWAILTSMIATLGLFAAIAIGAPTAQFAGDIGHGISQMSLLQY